MKTNQPNPNSTMERIRESIGLRSSHSSWEEEKEAKDVLLGILAVLVDRKKLKPAQIASAARTIKNNNSNSNSNNNTAEPDPSSSSTSSEIDTNKHQTRQNESNDVRRSCFQTDHDESSPSPPPSTATTTNTTTTTTNSNNTPRLPSKYLTRHIALLVHYDGSSYSGLAENINSPTDNSVERTLFAALQKTCLVTSRAECGYSRCGRTDRGVSAFGQVVALNVASSFPIGSCLLKSNTNSDSNTNTNGMDHDAKEDDQESSGEYRPLLETDMPNNSLQPIQCWIPKPNKTKPKKLKKKSQSNNGDTTPTTLPSTPTPTPSTSTSPLIETTKREKNYAQLLNRVLPPTIRILGWTPVSTDFSARFSAGSRTYRYFFIRRDLNLSAMAEALEMMVGTHDFRNLCKMNFLEVSNFVRVVQEAKVLVRCRDGVYRPFTASSSRHNGTTTTNNNTNNNDIDDINDDTQRRQRCCFEIKGQAFLWHQIRCMATILLLVGQNLEQPHVVQSLLDVKTNPGKPSYSFAPEEPLVLRHCGYRNLTMGYTAENLWGVFCDLEARWEKMVLAAERIHDALEGLAEGGRVEKGDLISFVDELWKGRFGRKGKKRGRDGENTDGNRIKEDVVVTTKDGLVTWSDALEYIHRTISIRPGTDGPKVPMHRKLMERSRGTTFEEKVQAIESSTPDGLACSTRRRERYQENVEKRTRQKNKEGDDKFYEKMLNQGGSGV